MIQPQTEGHPFFQSKAEAEAEGLKVGRPGDRYEVEADAMADRVVRQIHAKPGGPEAGTQLPAVQRMCADCQEEAQAKLQRQAEEEPEVQAKVEEEELQAKAEEEIQRQAEEETMQMKEEEEDPLQMQEEEEEPLQMQEEEEEPLQMQEEEASLQKQEEEEPAVQARGNGPARAGRKISGAIQRSRGGGRPLAAATRSRMEGAFGADFGPVRIHTDAQSVRMNKALHAQAFTHGSDIYFNEGKFRPGSLAGQHLLAHELTHVVQQGAAERGIQRQVGDGHDLTAGLFSGNAALEACFDGNRVVRRPDSGPHVEKLQRALILLNLFPPDTAPNGIYGPKTEAAVWKFQKAKGMGMSECDGRVGKKTLGLLDQGVRDGAVEPDADTAAGDFTVTDTGQQQTDTACQGQDSDEVCSSERLQAIDSGAQDAMNLIDRTISEQLPPVADNGTNYPDIFSRIFRNNDTRPLGDTVAEVQQHYELIKNFLFHIQQDRLHIRCGTECDGGCRSGSPAYESFDPDFGLNRITFCPDYANDPDRILITLHEAHHAVIPGSSDKAYAHTRLIDKLDHQTALLNAASFHLYAAWVDQPGSADIGPSDPDLNFIQNAGERQTVDLALAHIQQWFELIPFDISGTVAGMRQARADGAYSDHNTVVFMEEVFSKWFGLTRPPRLPLDLDIQKISAIEERVGLMEDAFSNPLLILTTPQHSFWERGPGSALALNDALTGLDLNRMIISLLQELVSATPGISAERESLYVLMINDMRNLRRLDP